MSRMQEIIDFFNLEAHPEGGFFAETFRSEDSFETERGRRSCSTSILFLITQDSISHFHRLHSDEAWYFHEGDPLKLIEITPDGLLKETLIGPNLKSGQVFQYIVKKGHWFASTSLGEFSLVGCSVSPGFEFEDFEMGRKSQLIEEFPAHHTVIEKFCLD